MIGARIVALISIISLVQANIDLARDDFPNKHRHRRFADAVGTGWFVSFFFDAVIPFNKCIDEFIAIVSQNKTEETEPCELSPVQLRLPDFGYDIDNAEVINFSNIAFWVISSLPFDIDGGYNVSVTQPFSTFPNKSTSTGNVAASGLLDKGLFSSAWQLSYSFPFVFLENITGRAVENLRDLPEEMPIFLHDLSEDVKGRLPRNAEQFKPSQEIINREIERIQMISGMQAMMESLDDKVWKPHNDFAQKSFFKSDDASGCVKRALCETALKKHEFDDGSFLFEFAKLFVAPSHVLPHLPRQILDNEHIQPQLEAFASGHCEKFVSLCSKSLYKTADNDDEVFPAYFDYSELFNMVSSITNKI